MFSVGIVGLPNAGKSTLFKALTKIAVPISIHPFTTIDPNRGIVEVKDKRLEKIKKLINPGKTIPVLIEFLDIAGLVKDAHLGKGLGNKFLSHINEVDLILEVIRLFINKKVPRFEESINFQEDINVIKKEITARDKKTLLSFIQSKEHGLKNKKTDQDLIEDIEVLKKIKKILEENEWLQDKLNIFSENEETLKAKKLMKEMSLLSSKPLLFLFNFSSSPDSIKERKKIESIFSKSIFIDAKKEEDILDLKDEEKEELCLKSCLDDLITNCYNKLNLITFYTIKGGKELRAFELKKGADIITAAGKVHSDFQKKFIKAEVLSFKDLENNNSWQEAKKKGLLQTKGKEHIVKDGDIIEFKI